MYYLKNEDLVLPDLASSEATKPQQKSNVIHFVSTTCHGCQSNSPKRADGTRAPPVLNEPVRMREKRFSQAENAPAQPATEPPACRDKWLHTYSCSVNVQEDRVLLSQRFQLLSQIFNHRVCVDVWINQSDPHALGVGILSLELLKQTIHVKGFS